MVSNHSYYYREILFIGKIVSSELKWAMRDYTEGTEGKYSVLVTAIESFLWT